MTIEPLLLSDDPEGIRYQSAVGHRHAGNRYIEDSPGHFLRADDNSGRCQHPLNAFNTDIYNEIRSFSCVVNIRDGMDSTLRHNTDVLFMLL